MPRTFTCLHCGETLPCNPRIKKGQNYCGAKECQRASRRAWKRKSYATKSSYRKKCRDSQKAWRKKYPADKYQRDYRKSHPEYERSNRESQRVRNKNRIKEPTPMIVKTDTLLLQPREDGAYMLSKVKEKMIVNRNTLSLQPSIDGAYALFKINRMKDCK